MCMKHHISRIEVFVTCNNEDSRIHLLLLQGKQTASAE